MTNKFMLAAINEAQKAAAMGEVPVGAVIVKDDKIIVSAHNQRETAKDPMGHAELIAIKKACDVLGSRRLSDCDLYVTLEPCPMCAGGVINSFIRAVYFGAFDLKNGALGSVCDLSLEKFTHRPNVYGGIMQDECSALMTDFFTELRN